MNKSEFDIDRAKLLVDEISRNLSTLPPDGASHGELRAEVDALKAILDRPDAQPAMVEQRMKSIYGQFDQASEELRADGIRVGIFLSEIGRMLGLD